MNQNVVTPAVWVYAVLCLGGIGRGATGDAAILHQVADEYGLQGDARKLLFVIRIVEDGVAGREMGVLTPAAQRYKGDHARSLALQARYAAGTIRRRYTGDLAAFAARWCPAQGKNLTEKERELNPHWRRNVEYWMAKEE